MKYFTIRLPEPGEIAVGDKIRSESASKQAVTVTAIESDTYWTDERDFQDAMGVSYFGIRKEKAQKLGGLLLCSRDIQPDTTVWYNDPDKKPDWSGYFHIDGYEQIGDVYLISGEVNGKQEKLSSDKDHLFKVIGEVSPGAVWVTEGMEFDESQFRLFAFRALEGEYHWYMHGVSDWSKFLADAKHVQVLCPNCKTFH